MEYRDLGKTGLKVSILGFGAMRLPPKDDWSRVDHELAVPMIRRALDAGVNYIDTAYVYRGSEPAVGEAIKGRRDDVILSTKIAFKENDPKKWRGMLDESLQRLGTDFVEVLHIHDVSYAKFSDVFVGQGLLKTVRKAQNDGLFKHLAFSSHDLPDQIVKLIETDEFDSMLVQYSFLDRRNEEAIALAARKGMGVAVMGPLGGGRLLSPEEAGSLAEGMDISAAALALRFAFSNADISVTLSGMSTMEQVEENVATAAAFDGLTHAQRERLEQMAHEKQKLADLYCTGCAYCMPCPNGVDIPQIFLLRNRKVVYNHAPARTQYHLLSAEGKGADQCVECGECEEKCPQNIKIIDQLAEAHQTLTGTITTRT